MTQAPLVVVNIVGLTPKLLAHMPRVSAVGRDGFQAELMPPLPAVTCTSQATFLTGESASSHGIVGNGWYFRDLGEVLLWRQHNALIGGENGRDVARRERPDLRVANLCWWYAMGAAHETARHATAGLHSDGASRPTATPCRRPCATSSPPSSAASRSSITGARVRTPPPRAWIGRAAAHVYAKQRPELSFVYLPTSTTTSSASARTAPRRSRPRRRSTAIAGDLIDAVRADGAEVVVLSSTASRRPPGRST